LLTTRQQYTYQNLRSTLEKSEEKTRVIGVVAWAAMHKYI